MMFASVKHFWTASIRRQLVLGIALVHAAMMTIFVFDLVERERDFLHRQSLDQAAALAQSLAVSSANWVFANDVAGMQELVRSQAGYPNVRYAMLVAPDGRVLAHGDRSKTGLYLSDAASGAMLKGAAELHVLADDARMIDAAQPVLLNGRAIGWARVGISQESIGNNLRVITLKGVAYTLVAIAVGTLFALFMGAGLTRGLHRLIAATHAFRDGDRQASADVGRVDEVGELAKDFNAMLATVVERESALFAEKERALVTLGSIGDAVITTGIDGRVENINAVAETLTGWVMDEARGRDLEEVFHIVSENSGESVDNPARRAIREGTVVGLANHTVLISRTGQRYAIEDSAAPIRDRQGNILGCVLVFHDVSQQRELHERMAWQAAHDPLTGLPNRVLLNDRLEQAIAHAQRQQTLAVLCFMDIDRFKPVNDQYGHDVGDKVLIEVANRLRLVVREGDTVARLGGDEFILLLTDMSAMDEALPVLQRILAATTRPFAHDGIEFHLSASIGVSVYPFDEVDADTLLRHADQAMYIAKESGRNGYHIFDAEQDKRAQTFRSQVERIRAALNGNELRLHYQPKVNMRSGEVIGFEALLRWQHPERGLVPPGEFLPLIEQSDLIIDVGEWVIKQAFLQMRVWLEQGVQLPVSVNIAARHLQLPDFVARMEACLKNYPDILPGQLELEILESAALDDMNHVRSVMRACRDRGINFALDDFGTGYSSLAYLKQLPAQTLKIDQTFVRDILDDPDDLALTQAVIGLGATFERTVIAEGVETAAHGVLLMRLGCDLAQGYGIARPMPPESVPEWVRTYKQDPQWALWRDIPWEMADFPLLIAQHDHLKWIKQVIDSIDGLPLRMPTEQLLDPHHCRFGLWYHGPGATRYGHLPAFAELGQVHDEVHRVGPEIVRLHHAGQAGDAQSLVPTLLDLKENIFGHLALLQHQVAETYGAEVDNIQLVSKR